jgi:hypothetical protein
MRGSASLVCGYLLFAACGQGAQVEPKPAPGRASVTTEQVSVLTLGGGNLDAFVAVVPATDDDGGECDTVERPGSQAPLYLLSFRRSNRAVRNVSVEFDSAGRPTHYSDLRGDLRLEKTGPQTSVVLSFRDGTARALNEWPGRAGEMAVGELSAALQARSLGYPQRMIDLIRTRCVKPGGGT